MTEKDDDKPVISLAAKREATERDFAQERSEGIKAILELGLSEKVATASTDEVLLCDWLVYRAFVMLGRWHDNPSEEAVVRLTELMRRGINDRSPR